MSEQKGLGALGTVLARDLTEIEDLPVYKTPLPGVYKFLIESANQKEINKKTTLVVEYMITDIVSLNNPEDAKKHPEQVVEPGEKFSEAFWFSDAEKIETTLSVLKAKFGPLGPALGTTNLLEIMQQMVGKTVQGIIQNRLDKDDKTKVYPSTRDLALAA